MVEGYYGELVTPLGGDTDAVPQGGALVGEAEAEVETEGGEPPDTPDTLNTVWFGKDVFKLYLEIQYRYK